MLCTKVMPKEAASSELLAASKCLFARNSQLGASSSFRSSSIFWICKRAASSKINSYFARNSQLAARGSFPFLQHLLDCHIFIAKLGRFHELQFFGGFLHRFPGAVSHF
jgi:hypothetical protein